MNPSIDISRRRFLRQTFAFSALAALSSVPGFARGMTSDEAASDLLMVGDWGADGNYTAQSGVAAGMRRYAHNQGLKTQALFMLGDNWYGNLAGGAQSPRWRTQFEEMYPAGEFACPAYAVLGNHDYQVAPLNKVDAELEYAYSGKSRFTMPARWYSFQFPAKDPLITFLALDSNVPEGDGAGGRKPGVDRRGFITMTPEQKAEQLSWLETELRRRRTTPFLVVIAHHPVYSDGPHGDHATLIQDWDPLFRKHDVHLYLAGHDHDLQHLEFENHPTSFFLSGGGGADLYNLKIEASQRGPYAQKVYGFSHLSVTPRQMTLRHLDSSGRVLHAFTKTPEGRIAMLT
jgi:tartrate-resistant acid phosphatase type 5